MKTIQYIKIALLLLLVVSCKKVDYSNSSAITKKSDYSVYLKKSENKKLTNINKDIAFWENKFSKAPNQYVYLTQLSGLYSNRFEITGTIDDLYKSEELLLTVNKNMKGNTASSGLKRSIAKNYISQHRFKEALSFLKEAEVIGENLIGTKKMLFDVNMELGNYTEAKNNLNSFTDFKDFDYLIRLAKLEDHNGRLPKAIELMEKAKIIAEEKKNEDLELWVYTNIGDYYGHDGQIEKSYASYLKALEIDNHNNYALKGIAWIAFSHEHNTKKANEILDFILENHKVPDLYLIKAEIAEYENNLIESKKAINSYNQLLKSKNYGDMYNKYNFMLWQEDNTMIDSAFKIAEREVNNRPTPESYDLLAWSYYKKGDYKTALSIAEKNTIGKSFEPTIVLHNTLILKANNELENKNEVKKELTNSIYELGPNYAAIIKNI